MDQRDSTSKALVRSKCIRHVVVSRLDEEAAKDEEEVQTKEIDDLANDNISRTIIFYANQTLRTIALCYRDLGNWPPEGVSDADEVSHSLLISEPC